MVLAYTHTVIKFESLCLPVYKKNWINGFLGSAIIQYHIQIRSSNGSLVGSVLAY